MDKKNLTISEVFVRNECCTCVSWHFTFLYFQ